jgi:hypothetical protein
MKEITQCVSARNSLVTAAYAGCSADTVFQKLERLLDEDIPECLRRAPAGAAS